MSDIAGRLQVLLAQEALNARKIEAEIEALRVENAKLREALKPFAEDLDDYLTDDYERPIVSFDDLRAARAAMGESDE